jgi:ATP-dependent protease ClpP protease subunit
MTVIQRVCLALSAVSMLSLQVACSHAKPLSDDIISSTSVTPPTTTVPALPPVPDPAPAPDAPDAGTAPAEQSQDDAPVSVPTPGLHKPADEKHFVPILAIRGPINAESAKAVEQVAGALNGSRHDPKQDAVEAVVVIIDTPGGDLSAGTEIVESLQSLEMPMVCVVDEHAYSMGFFILQAACPVRVITDRGSLMTHEPHIGGDVTVSNPTRWDLWGISEGLRVETEAWMSIAAKRMGIDLQSLLAKVRNTEWFMTPDEAKKANAVDCIIGNVQRDVVKPLQEGLELPHRLGVPAGLLRAPAAAPAKAPAKAAAPAAHRPRR